MNSIALIPVTVEEVKSAITSLKSNKSPGIDGISNNILKQNMEILSPTLTNLINECFEEGIFPDILKVSLIIPIYKSGAKTDLNNYRPISLLPSIGLLMEKLIQK